MTEILTEQPSALRSRLEAVLLEKGISDPNQQQDAIERFAQTEVGRRLIGPFAGKMPEGTNPQLN